MAYAYDCGSLRGHASDLNREIDVAVDRLDVIDMFFLSHFDFDHVSGDRQLLRGFTSVHSSFHW